MATITKEELINKIENYDISDEVKIELMEDITDSFNNDENTEVDSLREEVEKIKNENEDLKRKYKERFMTKTEDKKEDVEDIYKEKEIIDIKEI